MANGLSIQLEGWDELIATLNKAPAVLKEDVAVKLKDGAFAVQAQAKTLAPVKYGILRNSIVVDPVQNDGLTIGVSSLAGYSAYVEFGTGTKVEVPEGVEEYALQFKGNKEVPGMYPRPYFFPAVYKQIPLIVADLKKSVEKALTKA